jgi:hypothetical protein
VSTNIKELASAMVDPFQKGGFSNNSVHTGKWHWTPEEHQGQLLLLRNPTP